MSIPSWSCWVQIGAIVAMASSASRQRAPIMLELSSTTKIVSNSRRNAYGVSLSVIAVVFVFGWMDSE